MSEGTVRTCRACGEEKLIPFRKHKCEDCAGGKAAAPGRPPTPETNVYERPGGLGFRIQLNVDENTGATEILLEQWNAQLGKGGDWARIWLNQLEGAEVRTWLIEKLGAG